MFGKLFKHDFKSTAKVMLLFYAALILLSVISSVSLHFVPNLQFVPYIEDEMAGNFHFASGDGGTVFWKISSILLFLLLYFMIIAVSIATVVYSVSRFKNTVLGPEGYLTHTLPVKTRDIIISKTANAIVWQAFSVIAVLVAILIIVVSVPGGSSSPEVSETVSDEELTKDLIIVGETFALLFVGSVCFYLQVFASMSMGFSSNRYRMFKSVVIFVLIYWLESFIFTLLLASDIAVHSSQEKTISLLFIFILIFILLAVIFYFITHRFLTKKLNLQ